MKSLQSLNKISDFQIMSIFSMDNWYVGFSFSSVFCVLFEKQAKNLSTVFIIFSSELQLGPGNYFDKDWFVKGMCLN